MLVPKRSGSDGMHTNINGDSLESVIVIACYRQRRHEDRTPWPTVSGLA